MAAGPASENAGLQIERFCHPAFDALERTSAQLSSCNLDGERNAIEICTNPLDDGKLIRCWLKPSISQSGPFYEQTNCRGMPRPIMPIGIQRGNLVDGLALQQLNMVGREPARFMIAVCWRTKASTPISSPMSCTS